MGLFTWFLMVSFEPWFWFMDRHFGLLISPPTDLLLDSNLVLIRAPDVPTRNGQFFQWCVSARKGTYRKSFVVSQFKCQSIFLLNGSGPVVGNTSHARPVWVLLDSWLWRLAWFWPLSRPIIWECHSPCDALLSAIVVPFFFFFAVNGAWIMNLDHSKTIEDFSEQIMRKWW